MKIGLLSNQQYKTPKFGRKLREDEKPKYESDINKAFDYLGIKNRALIVHGSVYPEADSLSNNRYVGSPYYASKFNKFVKMNGFNCIQLGPNGELCKGDNSPYRASIYAKNPLFVNFGELKKDSFANILSEKEIRDINSRDNKKIDLNYDMADFDEAKEISKILIGKANKNFRTKLEKGDKKAIALNKEYEDFKNNNIEWLNHYATFRVLSDIHGTDNFHKWENPVDKNLITRKKQGNLEAVDRYNLIQKRSADDIEEYKFTQFIIDKQEKEDKEQRAQDGIKYIGDLLVGFSYADEWAHQDAFLPGWKIGAEYGGPCNSPQIWNNPLPDPDKLFKEDGSLGVSGKLLYNKVKKATENVENVRVDNVMGLVDPYVYNASSVHKITAIDSEGKPQNIADRGQLIGGNLSQMGQVDKYGNYKKILHNIVLPALRENGIDPQDAVWENLGEQSTAFKQVFENEEHLPGIILPTGGRTEELCFEYVPVKNEETGETQRREDGSEIWKKVSKKDWSLIGSHDNPPTAHYLNQGWVYQNNGGGYGWQSSYLGGYLNPDPQKSEERNRFVADIENNSFKRLKAKYAELMRGTQKIQVAFADFFGIDKIYNLRNDNSDCWKLRINKNYEDTFHKGLIYKDSPTMNMPEIVGIAVNAKAGLAVATGEKTREEAYSEVADIQRNLKHWDNVLKEPE